MINFAIISFTILTHIEPLPHEKISPTITLSGKCSNVIIDEWQEMPKHKIKIAIDHIDYLCNYSMNNIRGFLNSKEINYDKIALNTKISLLKYKGFRSLNDRNRFTFGNKVFSEKGVQLDQLGQYHYSTKRIFVDNQLYFDNVNFNSQFCSVMSHEIFHAVTKQNNLLDQMPEPHKKYDEIYAVQFEKFVENKMLQELFQ